MTKLSKLLWMLNILCEDDRVIAGMSDDTREIDKDWLYVCRKVQGERKKHYIEEALAKGAVVLCDEYPAQCDVYVCEQIEAITQMLIELYYGDLCATMKVIGVTGTNGKTSVSSYLYQLMEQHHESYMRIGTGEVCYLNQHVKIANTTPDQFQLAKWFALAQQLQLAGIVMEVSSHAIDANRICFIAYDIVIYTNITQDHLDHHITKTHYRFTKFKLRRYLKPNGVVIYNQDLPEMREFPLLYQGKCITIGEAAHMKLEDIQLSDHDASFRLQGYVFHTPLLGRVNVYNMACVISAARVLQLSYEQLQSYCEHVVACEGRMQVLHGGKALVWIDYAHTPDALSTLLSFANEVKRGRVITIIGCGGNRDRAKRAIMADIVSANSDLAIFTADNPRYEKVHDILCDMLIFKRNNIEVFENRAFAIKRAVKVCLNNDIIIIAGKGSEAVQSIEGHEYPFCDEDIVAAFLK